MAEVKLNEAETRTQLIDPKLKEAGWGVVPGSRVREEEIAPGQITAPLPGGGVVSEPSTRADYVLEYRGRKLAVIEAKAAGAGVTEGLAQAKDYAARLQTPLAYSTNGHEVYQVDRITGAEGPVEPAAYPTPDELWQRYYGDPTLANRWREAFGAVSFEDKGGQWSPRYYQHNAIQAVLDGIAGGRDRLLLTLATGTGKTAIAFQIAWKLFHARWCLANRENPQATTGRPRVLFLADRNILADQAFNAFGAFEDKALVRIDPKAIAKKGGVPTNGSVFFTIFQTLMTGDAEPPPEPPEAPPEVPEDPGAEADSAAVPASEPYKFEQLPADFFDFIVIDECHRGGANDESTWRRILEYFAPAVQLGLTATPKREKNTDTYAYFGKPVYTYSLKEGINDGYLTPFRVRQVQTTLDEYTFVGDDYVAQGEVDHGQTFTESAFNKSIFIKERERKRVKLLLSGMPKQEKAIVFCVDEAHAMLVRDLINQHRPGDVHHPDYCCRVTASEGVIGENHLKAFQDNEKVIPTVLTTSRKLSTGVDAKGVRHIALLRPVNTIMEFKQILGRGTRLFEGKAYFTLHDFVGAHHHFYDPEWDGEPIEKVLDDEREERGPEDDAADEGDESRADDDGWDEKPAKPEKVCIELAPGKERLIDSMTSTSFYSVDGRPIAMADFLQNLYGDLPGFFSSEAELRETWSDPGTRQTLLQGLLEKGYPAGQLREVMTLVQAQDSDLFDLLAFIAYNRPPLARRARVRKKLDLILEGQPPAVQKFLQLVLNHYVKRGEDELQPEKLPHLLELMPPDVSAAALDSGGASHLGQVFVGFQAKLYAEDAGMNRG